MASSQKTNVIFEQIKSNLKFVLIGIVFLILLYVGFLVAIGVTVALIITIPIYRLWSAYKMNKNNGSNKSSDVDDFIDADYEIIEYEEKRKKK